MLRWISGVMILDRIRNVPINKSLKDIEVSKKVEEIGSIEYPKKWRTWQEK